MRLFLLLGFFSVATASENIGFLFTAPKTFLSGYDENVCITLKNPKETVRVNVTVLKQKEETQIASAVAEVSPRDYGEKCFKISMPNTKLKNGRLQLTIHSKTEEDFKINYIEQILIQTNPDVTFVQTDKPVYNSGHVVRFRVFTLRSDLTPVLEPVDKIWIENPNGVHLVQWVNETTNEGFVTKRFQLSKDAFVGDWVIRVSRGSHVVEKSFRVEDYVPPKFFVWIKAPEYLDENRGNITVCAKYVFGEPVHGDVVLEYFIKCSFSYYCQETGSSISQNLRLNAEGCATYGVTLNNLSSFSQSVIVNATVFEGGTRAKAKAFSKIEIKNTKNKNQPEFSAATKHRKFKPGLPFKGQVVIKGQPGIDQMIQVCLDVNEEKTCREMLVRRNVADFTIFPVSIKSEKKFKVFLEIKNLRGNTQPNHVTKLNLVPWYSPSGSYLQLEKTSEEALQCGQRAKLYLLYSSSDPASSLLFHYMVKSRGDIISKGILDSRRSNLVHVREHPNIINQGDASKVMKLEFELEVTPFMAPRSFLIVYFILPNGEVVADSVSLKIEKCLVNKVVTKWRENSSLPKSENQFRIEAAPNSLCALAVTDKSTKLMGPSDSFDVERVFYEIEKYQVKPQSESGSDRCRDNSEPYGYTKMNDIEPLSYPHESGSRFVDSLKAFNDFGALVITDLDLETRPCREKAEENVTTRNSKINVSGNEIENISVFKAEEFPEVLRPNRENIRSFFPETWIWELIPINDSGTAEMDFQVPHTLTEWTAETVCLSATKGLGVSEPSRFFTHQPFFLDFSVPHSLKRKEIFHLHVSVFNYEASDLPVRVTLYPVESFTTRSEGSRSYCIRTRSKVVLRFVLETVKLGEAEIKVKAEIDSNFPSECGNVIFGRSDIVVKKTIVKHEGFPLEKVKSGFICGNNSYFDHEVLWSMRVPWDVIESSIQVKASVSGDILGPTLQSVDSLIMLPTGCGEQNMLLLVPNILFLNYLLLTKSEDLEPIERALKNLDLGYQRQLNYKHPDGSYSAFGDQDEKGSIWLTSFVVRYLSQAKKYIYVDENDLNASIAWITKHQLENGCFPMIGKIYHRKLQEKLLEEDSSKTLTAYILISLLEAGISSEDPVVRNAIYCLKPMEESLGTYGDLISAYALILAGEFRDSQALVMELLKEAKTSYGALWWEGESIESSIEMTGYGILALIKLGGSFFMAAASDAIRWIIRHQNQNGGFVSSQDTVLALEAISKFSASLPKTGENDILLINLHTRTENYTFNITQSNRLLQQELTLPNYEPGVRFQSTGSGCALVQTFIRYNVRHANPDNDLKIVLRTQSASDVDLRFHICVRYKTHNDKINMAVLEVPMISGYYPDRSSLYRIRTSVKGVRRWEEYEEKIIFYFEELANKKVCVSFWAYQKVCVENPAPALIKLYDYYNTRHFVTKKYSFHNECHNDTWLEIKQESKRDLEVQNFYGRHFKDFVDVEEDLETPKGVESVFPVYALPPRTEQEGRHCAHCLTKIPEIFHQLYCSSSIAIKIRILNRETFEFRMDVSPRKNFTPIKRTVPFTMREGCECLHLNSANHFALLLVTPPRSFRVTYLQELYIDDSVQLYPWGEPNEIPEYLRDAIKYCPKWPLNDH